MPMSAMTSSTSCSFSILRAAGPSLPGKTGWWTTRPAANSSAQMVLGNEKWAEWSPCRWPISRRPTLNANSPRRPGPASTPGHEVTSSVICLLALSVSVMPSIVRVRRSGLPGAIGPRTSGRAQLPQRRAQLLLPEAEERLLVGGRLDERELVVAGVGPLLQRRRELVRVLAVRHRVGDVLGSHRLRRGLEV